MTAVSLPRPRLLAFGLAAGGGAALIIELIVGSSMGIFPSPSGDELIWDRTGDALRAGLPLYDPATPVTEAFWYAPPLAVLFALFSWLPADLVHWLFVAIRILSLRVVAGSWIGAGIACWIPLVAFDVGGGNFNLPVAAAIVAAVRGEPRLAVWAGLAKLGPFLAIDRRDWRKAAAMLVIAVVVTIPWLGEWAGYVTQLTSHLGTSLGPQVPVGLGVRLAIAGALLLLIRAPWARALAATLAIPAFYWASLVILLAPIAVYLRDRGPRPVAPAFAAAGVSG